MTDKEAVEEIKSLLLSLGGQEYLKEEEPENYKLSKAIETVLNLIQTQQKEIEKKDKIIDEMAKWLCEDDTIFGYGGLKEINTHEKIKEYFKKKVEGI